MIEAGAQQDLRLRDPRHLQRYVVEEVCRFNARHDVDGGRFVMVLQQTEGKRLTYAALTGKGASQSAAQEPSAR